MFIDRDIKKKKSLLTVGNDIKKQSKLLATTIVVIVDITLISNDH